MTTQPMTNPVDNAIINKATELFGHSKPTPVESTKPKRRYDIEVDDDTHWELVRMAARQKQHQEDYVEQLLVKLAAGHRAAIALIKDIEEAAS